MKNIISIGMPGGPEILFILFTLMIFGIIPLFIAYRIGYNQGRKAEKIRQMEERLGQQL